jgi:cellulose synthase/poly-beta-1,6-N-acetylglucosamine synthase-like glycosyltransferase
VLSIAGLKKREILEKEKYLSTKILILIPCYKDYKVILETAHNAINQDYPRDNFQVIVIADTIPNNTMQDLKNLPLIVKEVSFEKSTKVKALNAALDSVEGNWEAVIILDSDNLMEDDFLRKFSYQFAKGSKVIQGQRLPKNSNTEVTFLDGLSEKINNHINRKGSSNIHLSSSIAGSGFGGDLHLIRNVLKVMDSVGGYDKELEILLLEKGYRTEYFENLILYEEKVENLKVFKNQRRRWISSQYHYLGKYYKLGIFGLLKGKFSLFNSIILRNLQLPRILNLGLLPIILVYAYYISSRDFMSFYSWVLLALGYLMSFLLALPGEFYSIKGLKSLFKIPGLFWIMLKLLFKLKGANSTFIHTPKGSD